MRLPDSFIKISPKFRWTKSSSSKVSETNTTYYQDEHVLRVDRAGGQELHVVSITDLMLLRRKRRFLKFNVIKSMPRAPRGAEVMRTKWVVNEKVDNLSKT